MRRLNEPENNKLNMTNSTMHPDGDARNSGIRSASEGSENLNPFAVPERDNDSYLKKLANSWLPKVF